MSWPLTGNALSRFNNLMSDLRQYGDFPFVGSPDDITILWQTIKEASGGALNPPLDDVANRSHYWTLRLVEYLGSQITPCPPCPPATQTGVQWGPDSSTIIFSDDSIVLKASFLDTPSTTSITFSNLVSMDDLGGGYDFSVDLSSATNVAFSFPELVSFSGNSIDGGGSGDGIGSWSSPKLKTFDGDFSIYGNPITFLDLSSLETVSRSMDVVESVDLTSAEYPSLTSVGQYFYCAASCPNLTSVTAPVLENVGTNGGGILYVYDCPLLPSVAFPALTEATDGVWIYQNDTITSVSLPNLVTTAEIEIFDSPQLTTIDLSSFVPTDGSTINCSNNALTAATVNHILRRAAANAGYVSGVISLDLGTNAAPTGQGVIDKNDLIARGVIVNTN